MDTMITVFPNRDVPLRVNGGASPLDKSPGRICIAFDCGSAYVTLHSVTPEMVRTFAAQLVEAVDRLEATVEAVALASV